MKSCVKCKKKFKDGEFCPECGGALLDEIKKPTAGIFFLIAVIAVVCCAAGGLGLHFYGDKIHASTGAQEFTLGEDGIKGLLDQTIKKIKGEDAEENYAEASSEEAEDAVIIPAEYILPDSSSRFLGKGALVNLSQDQLKKARNEIFARHGRKFDDPELQNYFNGLSWYQGTTEAADFSEEVLNEYELANVKLIADYETEMGYR